MKKLIGIILSILFVFGTVACGKNEITKSEDLSLQEIAGTYEGELAEEDVTDSSKILVAYFSATGNTERLAKYAVDYLNAEEFKIEAKVPYTEEDLNYNKSDSRSTIEQKDASARPEIDGVVENMERYDTIILAYPIWWGQSPKIVYTFLESYDFSDKTIIPFCTSASSGIGNSANNLHSLTDENTSWADGCRFSENESYETFIAWLNKII